MTVSENKLCMVSSSGRWEQKPAFVRPLPGQGESGGGGEGGMKSSPYDGATWQLGESESVEIDKAERGGSEAAAEC